MNEREEEREMFALVFHKMDNAGWLTKAKIISGNGPATLFEIKWTEKGMLKMRELLGLLGELKLDGPHLPGELPALLLIAHFYESQCRCQQKGQTSGPDRRG